MELVPIKVKIRLKTDGAALYPSFNDLQVVRGAGLDWSIYVDRHGSGWLYDCCGHKEEEPRSPIGIQWGMLLVPLDFANQAVSAFPNEVTKLTEPEAKTFYEDNHAAEFEDEEIDEKIIHTLKTKKDLGQNLSQRQLSALDPTTDTRGIRANWRKTWDGFKGKRGITMV